MTDNQKTLAQFAAAALIVVPGVVAAKAIAGSTRDSSLPVKAVKLVGAGLLLAATTVIAAKTEGAIEKS